MRLKVAVLIVLVVLSVFLPAAFAAAGNSTLSYTAAQSTAIQNQLIPRYNAEHCGRFSLPNGCTTSDLTTAGCNPANFTVKTVVYDSCTIFTSDATGEAAFLKEVANQGLVAVNNKLISIDVSNYNSAACTAFKAANQAGKDALCTGFGLSAGCAGPCP